MGGAQRVMGRFQSEARGAVSLDGKHTSIGIAGGLHPWLGASAVTFVAVLRTKATSGVLAGNGSSMEFGTLKGGAIGMRINTVCVFSNRPINDGGWHHVAFTRDAGTGRLGVFVDGVAAGAADGPRGTLVGEADRIFSFGRLESGRAFFQGDIDELRLYNHVLPPGQIAKLASDP